MDIKSLLGALSVILTLWCAVPYIKGVLAGRAKPHAFTWLLWTLTGGIGAAAQLWGGAGPGAWCMAVSAFLCAYVFLLALRCGERNIRPIDWAMLAFGLTAIPLWLLTNDALWSVIVVCAIDALAYGPTFRKSWHKPHEEVMQMYIIAIVWNLLALCALRAYTPVTMLAPATLLAMNTAFVAFLALRRRAMAHGA